MRSNRDFEFAEDDDFLDSDDESMFVSLLRGAFIDVYAPDNYDIATSTLINFSWDDEEDEHLRNPLVILTSFFGLSNYCEPGEKFTEEKLKQNVFGSFSGFLKNAISALFTTPQSIAKLFTEFLPLFAYWGLLELVNLCLQRGGGFMVLAVPAIIFAGLFKVAHLVGRAVTSPIESVRNAWFFCVKPELPTSTPRVILGLVFATASILITMTIYSVLFSLIAPAMGLGLAQLGFMTPQASAAFAFIGNNIMLPMLAKAGAALSPVVAGFTAVIGASIGLVLTTVGTALNELFTWSKDKWRKNAQTPVQISLDFEPVEPVDINISHLNHEFPKKEVAESLYDLVQNQPANLETPGNDMFFNHRNREIHLTPQEPSIQPESPSSISNSR